MTIQDSFLHRFIFENTPIRGERVLVSNVWQEILSRRSYPYQVQKLLGELVATTALLGATIKIEGKLTVQVESTGPIKLLVVQINDRYGLRATATYEDELPETTDFRTLVGEGRVVITLDSPKFKEPYQGVIAIDDASIELMIQRYFSTSEQLDTHLFLRGTDHVIGGLLLQRLPGELLDQDDFNRVCQLAATVTDEELVGLDTQTLIYRLYSEDDVRLFEPEALHFECNCSKERSYNMLRQLGKNDIDTLFKEQGKLEVSCEFCGEKYLFNPTEFGDA